MFSFPLNDHNYLSISQQKSQMHRISSHLNSSKDTIPSHPSHHPLISPPSHLQNSKSGPQNPNNTPKSNPRHHRRRSTLRTRRRTTRLRSRSSLRGTLRRSRDLSRGAGRWLGGRGDGERGAVQVVGAGGSGAVDDEGAGCWDGGDEGGG